MVAAGLVLGGTCSASAQSYPARPVRILTAETGGGSDFVRSGVLGAAAIRFVRDGVKRGEISRRHRPEILADLLLGALTIAVSNWSAGEEAKLERSLAESARALLDVFTAGGK